MAALREELELRLLVEGREGGGRTRVPHRGSGSAWGSQKPGALTEEVGLQGRRTAGPCPHPERPRPDRQKGNKKPSWWGFKCRVCT